MFVRQFDGEADGFATRFVSASISRFHDAGAAAGTDHEAARLGTERERPTGELVRQLARFFVVARHFERAFGAAQSRTVPALIFHRHFTDFRLLEPRVARLRGFVRLDARRTKHHNGVADALVLELPERMNVFAENANRPRGHAVEKFLVFVRDLGGVLGFELLAVGHVSTLQKRRTLIVGIPGGLRQRLPAKVRRIEYTPWGKSPDERPGC